MLVVAISQPLPGRNTHLGAPAFGNHIGRWEHSVCCRISRLGTGRFSDCYHQGVVDQAP